jgi:hypothetical protein
MQTNRAASEKEPHLRGEEGIASVQEALRRIEDWEGDLGQTIMKKD